MTFTEVEAQYAKDIRELGIEMATKRYDRRIKRVIQQELRGSGPKAIKAFKQRLAKRKLEEVWLGKS